MIEKIKKYLKRPALQYGPFSEKVLYANFPLDILKSFSCEESSKTGRYWSTSRIFGVFNLFFFPTAAMLTLYQAILTQKLVILTLLNQFVHFLYFKVLFWLIFMYNRIWILCSNLKNNWTRKRKIGKEWSNNCIAVRAEWVKFIRGF